MRYREILREMTHAEATAIWQRHGVDPTTTPDLHAAFKKLSRQHHPDKEGGNNDDMALINAAYDVLKKPNGAAQPNYHRGSDQREPDAPAPWAHAGYSGGMANSSRIYRNDYTDVNYIKKRMWELSDHSTEEWSITGFDGNFTRASTTVYGSPEIFAQMAEALITWQTKGGNSYLCRAVFVQKRHGRDGEVLLIWADGVFYDKQPIPLDFESFNRNPSNDQNFGKRLRELIDKLKENGGRQHEQSSMDTDGSSNKSTEFETGSYVVHPKFGVGRIINPLVKKNMARVNFKKHGAGNVKITSLRQAKPDEEWQFEHGE